MGKVVPFPNRSECPPHDWVSVYDEELGAIVVDGDDEFGPEYISGRVCTKCSLIESGESLTRFVATLGEGSALGVRPSGGTGQGFLHAMIKPLLSYLAWPF